MINYFAENSFSLRTYTKGEMIKFNVTNAFELGITIRNVYGFVVIEFGNSNLKNKFIELANIVYVERIMTQDEINKLNLEEAFKKIEGDWIKKECSSVNFPCRIYLEKNDVISFYDNKKILESEEIINHRKMIFNRILFLNSSLDINLSKGSKNFLYPSISSKGCITIIVFSKFGSTSFLYSKIWSLNFSSV